MVRKAGWPFRFAVLSVHLGLMVLIGTLLPGIDPLAGQSTAQIHVEQQAELLAGQLNMHRAVSAIVDQVRPEQPRSFPVQLVAGVTNAVVAACAEGCDHIQVALYDYQHRLLMRSVAKEPIAIISGVPLYTGLHEIEVGVPGCGVAKCEVAMLLLRGEPASGPAVEEKSSSNSPAAPNDTSLVEALQKELKRVACDPGPINGTWAAQTQQALVAFAKKIEPGLPTNAPSAKALAALTAQPGAVCDRPEVHLNKFDGLWIIHWRGSGERPCKLPGGATSGSYTITIRKSVIGAGTPLASIRASHTAVGKITPTGEARWRANAITDGALIRIVGTFRDSASSGNIARIDGKCTATFSGRRA